MSGLTAIFGIGDRSVDCAGLLACINPLQSFSTHETQCGDNWFAVSYPTAAPLADSRFYSDDRFTCLLAGDLVCDGAVPWQEFIQVLGDVEQDRSILQGLQGSFVLLVWDSQDQLLSVVTDSFGMQPVYTSNSAAGLLLSTALGSFLREKSANGIVCEEWLHEYLFFNYPVQSRTPVNGVMRLKAGVIYQFDARTGEERSSQYLPYVSSGKGPSSRELEIEEARSLFGTIVPKWFRTGSDVAFGLSGGLDSRAVLAALPESDYKRVHSFTYGIPGSTEIVEAREIADAVGLDHREIFLRDQFLKQLPELLYDTVFLSDGQQVINRSNLPLVYGSLGSPENPVSAILTGVSGDHLFRDHISAWGNVPYLVSADVAAMHRHGRQRLNRDFYSSLFVKQFSKVEALIEESLDGLEAEYGTFGDAEAYFRFLMYVASPKYFGGQAAIANQYSTFRTPYWDRELVQFSMNIQLGTVGLSRLKDAGKDKFLETTLQASVVAANRRLARVPYTNLPIDVFTSRSRLPYQFHRAIRRLKASVLGRKRKPEEDWPQWYKTVLADEIRKLFNKDCLVKEYVNEDFIDRQIATTDIHWLGKLITVEITLRLIANGWKR